METGKRNLRSGISVRMSSKKRKSSVPPEQLTLFAAFSNTKRKNLADDGASENQSQVTTGTDCESDGPSELEPAESAAADTKACESAGCSDDVS